MLDHRLRVSSDVAAVAPDYRALVVYVTNAPNGPSDEASSASLAQAEANVRASFAGTRPADHEFIRPWRALFGRFGAKPSRYKCSVERLLDRVLKGQPLPRINRWVDLYNAVSLEAVVPVGGEDWSRISSDLVLIRATGDEIFHPTGAPAVSEKPEPGELVWCDSQGPTVRRLNYSQCHRTLVTESTRDMYFVFDCVDPIPLQHVRSAARSLTEEIRGRTPSATVAIEEIAPPAPAG